MYPDLTLPDLIACRFPIIETLESAEKTTGFIVAIGWLALQVKSRLEAGNSRRRKGIAVTLLKKLHAWRTHIVGLTNVHEDLSRAQNMMLFLDIWIKALFIRTATDERLADGETRYDGYLKLFQQTIQQAERLLLQAGPDIWMGIVTPLVFCTLKCRDWHIRRVALQLLKISLYSKGKWSVANTALVIERVIQMESEGLTPHHVIPEASRIDSLRVEFVPGKPRIQISCRLSHLT
jgi:hypothetical protein